MKCLEKKRISNMSYNPFTLEGKTIFITGASSGIGRETAIQCAKMGAQLIITGRNEVRIQECMSKLEGCGHRAIVADLTRPDNLEVLVNASENLDGLVLCAGRGLLAPFLFSDSEKYREVFDTNFFAPIELLRLLVKKKKIQKDSSVVVVTSIGGVCNYAIGSSVYGPSKAALHSAMKQCALELAPRRIRVNGVSPGMVNTPLIAVGDSPISDQQLKADVELYPLKRYGETQDVAYGIIYLLSDASSWVTGHTLVVDGGRTLV